MSENFGKIMQDRQSLSINSADVSVSKSAQLDYAIPAAKIAALSSGEFVGITSDNPEQEIELKMFHSEVQNDHNSIAAEEAGYKSLPKVERVSYGDVVKNYLNIKEDVRRLVKLESEKLRLKYRAKDDGVKKVDGGEGQGVVL